MRLSVFGFIPLLLVCSIACDSSLKTADFANPENVGCQITVHQDPQNKQINDGIIVLVDKQNREIANDSIYVIVNDSVLRLTHGGFYTGPARYTFSNIPVVNNEYLFQLKVKDNEPYYLGKITALSEETQAKISCDHKGDLNQDLIISWSDLNEINQLKISRSFKRLSDANPEIYSLPDEVIAISRSGSATLPTATFKDKDAVVYAVEFTFSVNKKGQTNPKLLPLSQIEINTTQSTSFLKKSVVFENPSL